MYTILFVSLLVIAIIVGLTIFATNKAYSVKEEIDDLENNPHLDWMKEKQSEKKDDQRL